MKTLKMAVAALIIAGGTISAFAFTKGDNKNSNSDDKAFSYNYFITGTTTVGGIPYYIISTSDPGCPDTGAKPCEVESKDQEVGGKIKQDAVTQVLSLRP